MTDETALYLRVRGEMLRVNGRSAVVGRSRSCDVQLDVHGVSRRHCEVLLKDDGASIRDLGSTHGTWIDGRRVVGEARLAAGALISLGQRGPHFELANAIVHGRPVLGVSPDAPPPAAVSAQADAAPAAPASGSSRFPAGLAWGVLVGVVAGLGVLALVDVRF